MTAKTMATQWLMRFNPLLLSFLAGAACLRLWELYQHGRLLSADGATMVFFVMFSGILAIGFQYHSPQRN